MITFNDATTAVSGHFFSKIEKNSNQHENGCHHCPNNEWLDTGD